MTARNAKIVQRFYFYSEIIGLKKSACLELLEKDFDISPSTLWDIIKKHKNTLYQYKMAGITIKQLNEANPFLNWKYPF
ncbi:hypothetical protein CAPN010_11050 [Capnocytophaga cynodegmi]|uniref:hypothetical protein n=1 Tax=Capnocytophaga cynodegmi TaxID=28189 RepID=UPI001EE25132|nr:hypothetical protein [Capnocytophaga cynodegmi]GJQ06947.1 hypothetical protein CAPN010_11050 [Capnocytophaga cynodegmi]